MKEMIIVSFYIKEHFLTHNILKEFE